VSKIVPSDAEIKSDSAEEDSAVESHGCLRRCRLRTDSRMSGHLGDPYVAPIRKAPTCSIWFERIGSLRSGSIFFFRDNARPARREHRIIRQTCDTETVRNRAALS